jgi:hypothetical protein
MRAPGSIIAALLLAAPPAMAQSKWVESGRLDPSEVGALCVQASDVRSLARNQMITIGGERWRRLSRQELVVEAFIMGAPPLDPGRCYVVARAGRGEETERRAFEVRDFAVNAESTTVFVIGRNFALATGSEAPSP